MSDARRELPSVSALLDTSGVRLLLAQHPRRVVLDAVRSAVDAARSSGDAHRTEEQWIDSITSVVRRSTQSSLRRVINATGVVLHTNLGRAPLAEVAIRAIEEAAGGFSNLEYDIETGQRGSRYSHCVGLLRQLTG
ncbi:MAG: L-seryl-tRNA(Sec) selenium transferase, partial [Gemmatimonadales bacterium]